MDIDTRLQDNTSEVESKKDNVEDKELNETNVSDSEQQVRTENEDSRNSIEQTDGKTSAKVESEVSKLTDENSMTESSKDDGSIKGTENEETDHSESKKAQNSESNETEESEKKESENSESKKGQDSETGKSKNDQSEIVQNGTKEDDKTMEIDENEDEDDDFNPLLLCPDISMDIDESPVLTGSTEPSHSNDTTDPNSLYAPLFSTFVDEMTGAEISFNLTAEEQQLRERLYGPNNPIQFTKIHCTACNVHLGSALAGQTNRFVHPLLKVLICKECYHFYTSGEFEKDEDGSELYCRWCGQGGQVLCCTMCEFVFCKKCIRINFGRKKLTQVRDSDEWKCFRCDISQLKALRAMCVEFFEYVRKETARASTYTDPDIVNRDLTNCCQSQNRKRQMDSEKETEKEVVKRPKRRRQEEDDPDYNPYAQHADERSNSPIASTSGVKVVANVPKTLPALQPKPVAARSEVSFIGQSPSATVRIGSTVINVKSTGTSGQLANASPSAPRNTAIRTPVPNARPKPTFTPRNPTQSAARSAVTPAAPAVGSLAHIRSVATKSQATPHSQPMMKHEWFEKTVRAAARVNSNLSYTLTQLNKAQSSASSVEQLAVVHNKLQEILSSSINSLIQIRKNLRTEFIAGIKTFRFPPKPAAVDPSDDDVIIVNPEPTTTTNNRGMMPSRPRNSAAKVITVRSVPSAGPNIAKSASTPPNKGYLKVRSFQQLQNVSSECITIPDDDPPPLAPIEPISIEINEDRVTPDPLDGGSGRRENEEASTSKGDGEKGENKDEGGSEKTERVVIEDEEEVEDKEKEKVENKAKEKVEDKAKEKVEDKAKEKVENKAEDKAKEKVEDKDKRIVENNDKEKVENKDKEKVENENKKKVEENVNKDDKEESAIKDKPKKTNGKREDEDKDKRCAQNGDKNDKRKEAEESQKKKKDVEVNGSDSNGSAKCNGDIAEGGVKVKTEPEEHSYNVKDQPTPKIRRMLSVKVNLKKTTIVEDLVKKEPVESGDN
ncbi:transcription initiation factor TFIID subunit 3-like isoform X2 [Coccinella septempunctata]|uniref:transcription initiation factor TFIID subunit 3-like isoform X2 n=1 Tax=Coccinella septempunctata TaxID=41139 RepID=UPI001D072CE7|nr:transcription initiation factor TFIID subunit 3-like isoform X2 [Coccinella septempunctata]